jgi:hypothetical protein
MKPSLIFSTVSILDRQHQRVDKHYTDVLLSS